MGVNELTRAAVFLDRDGVVVDAIVRHGIVTGPRSIAELRLASGAYEICSTIRDAGLILVVATNQPEVARGTIDAQTIHRQHELLQARLPLHDIRVCFHDDVDGCPCRKPRPGLLLDAAADWGIDLRSSFMVGDRWRDVQAGAAAGCTTVLLERTYSEVERCAPDHRVATLEEANRLILGVMR